MGRAGELEGPMAATLAARSLPGITAVSFVFKCRLSGYSSHSFLILPHQTAQGCCGEDVCLDLGTSRTSAHPRACFCPCSKGPSNTPIMLTTITTKLHIWVPRTS